MVLFSLKKYFKKMHLNLLIANCSQVSGFSVWIILIARAERLGAVSTLDKKYYGKMLSGLKYIKLREFKLS